jgi:Transglutaminase-like superfamily
MAGYFLRHNVHCCLAGSSVVFLDLEREKYFGLNVANAPEIHEAITSASHARRPEVTEALEKLIEQQLLTLDRTNGRALAPPPIDPADNVLFDLDVDGPRLGRHIRIGHVVRLLWAYAIATTELRLFRVRHAVTRIRKRRLRHLARQGSYDLQTAREAVAAFLRIRPLLYTAGDRCLVDSLTMVEFLARYGVFPVLVIGVRSHPFMAHSWVQDAGFVFNDHPARTRSFTPIVTG